MGAVRDGGLGIDKKQISNYLHANIHAKNLLNKVNIVGLSLIYRLFSSFLFFIH